EKAQSEAATGARFVNYWLHCQHLLVNGQKMAKSLGNFITLQELLSKGYSPRGIRFLLISTHYRRELNFTLTALESEEKTVKNMVAFVTRLLDVEGQEHDADELLESTRKRFEDALDDDLDIRGALVALFEFISEVNRRIDDGLVGQKNAQKFLEFIFDLDKVLGLRLNETVKEERPTVEIEVLIQKREESRQRKNWAEADKIRSQLQDMGVFLEDTLKGVRWKIIKKAS
ncbi:class I tRNA ligase family protein, partial [Candidatus Bathyarchaeota archaeon]|nr:class I tRNA ligase family protein [Candidatus Bathyarchaeota archaeon]